MATSRTSSPTTRSPHRPPKSSPPLPAPSTSPDSRTDQPRVWQTLRLNGRDVCHKFCARRLRQTTMTSAGHRVCRKPVLRVGRASARRVRAFGSAGRAGAEQDAAEADLGGTTRHGEFVVATHPHRAHVEAEIVDERAGLHERPGRAAVSPSVGPIVISPATSSPACLAWSTERRDVLGRATRLRLLGGRVHLDQDPWPPVDRRAISVAIDADRPSPTRRPAAR